MNIFKSVSSLKDKMPNIYTCFIYKTITCLICYLKSNERFLKKYNKITYVLAENIKFKTVIVSEYKKYSTKTIQGVRSKSLFERYVEFPLAESF